jgi:hypothetical protein
MGKAMKKNMHAWGVGIFLFSYALPLVHPK